MTCELK